MFPSLFSKKFVESFNICQLVKLHRATYPPSNTKYVHHFDVWGPASNSSIYGAKLLKGILKLIVLIMRRHLL